MEDAVREDRILFLVIIECGKTADPCPPFAASHTLGASEAIGSEGYSRACSAFGKSVFTLLSS